jgi:hypothetical protein
MNVRWRSLGMFYLFVICMISVFCGLPYTWDNGRSGNANVRVHLDKVVADPTGREAFNDAKVHHLISSRSYHCPVLVELRKDAWEWKDTRTFKYEIMWEHGEAPCLRKLKRCDVQQLIEKTLVV